MKTLNLKTLGRSIGVLSLTALMLTSCGSDSNEAEPVSNTTTNSNNNNNNSGIFGNSGTNSNDSNLWNSLKNQANCSQGRMNDLSLIKIK